MSTVTPGRVFWITGLSGSGKTTLAIRLAERLRALRRNSLILDGDDLRAALGLENSHASGDRLALAFCYGRLSRLFAVQGFDVIVATISLFHQVHAWNRENLPNYVEIVLDVTLEELRRRDPKNLYAGAQLGTVSDVPGLDQAIELPMSPDIVISCHGSRTVEETFAEMLDNLHRIHALV